MEEVFYFIWDEELWEYSDNYDTLDEAKNDLENCISHKWSDEAEIVKVTRNDESDNDTGVVFNAPCSEYIAKHYKTISCERVI